MPWAKTELTAHLSPTKTPEYLAGGKPVVSVRIRDVERDYGDVVLFGDTPGEFADAVEQALRMRDRDWAKTLEGREAARTWDQIVEEMMRITESTSP
jgi:UDP-galactopyranose mutase